MDKRIFYSQKFKSHFNMLLNVGPRGEAFYMTLNPFSTNHIAVMKVIAFSEIKGSLFKEEEVLALFEKEETYIKEAADDVNASEITDLKERADKLDSDKKILAELKKLYGDNRFFDKK